MNSTRNVFLKLFILLTSLAGWSGSAWAQSPTIATGIYRIATSYSDDRGIIIDKGGNYVTVSKNQYNTGITAADNNNSLWYVYQSPNGCYLIASLSYYSSRNNDVYFLKGAGANTSYQSNTAVEWNFTFKTNSNRTGNNTSGFDTTPAKADYFEIALASNPTRYLKSTPGYSAEADKLRMDYSEPAASYLEFQSRDESVLSNDQKALLTRINAKIEDYLVRFTTLPNGTKLRFEDTSHNAITSTSAIVKYSPVDGGNPVELSSSNATYDFHDVLFNPSAFSGSFNFNIEGISYDKATQTLTFRLTRNKWYKMRVANVNAYVSSDYTNDDGILLHNSTDQPNPTTYAGIWRSVDAGGDAANSDGSNVTLYNALYYDTKLLAMTKPTVDGQARGDMYAIEEIPAGAATVFEQRIKSDQTDSYYFRITGTDVNTNTYINQRDPYFSNWTNGGYGGNGSRFIVEAVPELGNNVSIVINGESGSVTYNTQCVALPGEKNVILTHGAHYDFKNMPYLASLFKATDYDKHISAVTFNETTQTLTFTLIKLHAIIHRPHATFQHLAEQDEAHKPSNKFIQVGQEMIDHPYADNFTGADYTDNDRQMQNTSVFRITQYAKKGGTTSVALPHTRTGGLGKISRYQRLYDYETERCLDEGILQNVSGYTRYYNGIAKGGVSGSLTIQLPRDKDEIYIGVDDSEFNDYSAINTTSDLREPSLSMRTIIHVVSAEKMAESLDEEGGEKWFEEKTYIVPNIKRGSAVHRNNSDILPLNMPFSNYWIYTDASHKKVMRIVNENGSYNTNDYNGTLGNNVSFEVEGDAKDYITVGIFKDKASSGIDNPLGVSYNHFIYYNVTGKEVENDGLTRKVPAGSQAVIKMYVHNGQNGTKYQLAKFTLNFQADCEPLAITSVVGNESSTRSTDYFKKQQMAEVASLTFGEKRVDFKGLANVGGNSNHYAFPLDPTRTSYAFSPDDAFGGYRITKSAYGMKVFPVSLYERNIKQVKEGSETSTLSLTPDADDYYLYIDAAESPGQVASIPLDGNLCAGTRLFFYGWVNSQNPFDATNDRGNPNNATAASVILELVGRKDGEEVTLASYLPGIMSDAAYTPEGTLIRSVEKGGAASEIPAYSSSFTDKGHNRPDYIAAWQSVGFTYLITETGFDGFELRVINNCFSTAGGDYSLDDFRVFAKAPKGEVDFTTPLCSDKVRHAKIHADYDMLSSLSNSNEKVNASGITATYCFVDAEIFDNYTEGGYLIKDMFEIDESGNHNLKPAYNAQTAAVSDVINHAFRDALVGSRYVKDKNHPERTDYGYHTYVIKADYNQIPEYAYNDSQNEVIYREQKDDGIRRIVFKEDVVRGEMHQVPAEKGNEEAHPAYWPHLRPSRTYYLVFSPILVDQEIINDKSTATQVFEIHTNCSFFGKFTTKDPMHVIADNAEIEADLPVRAICHGESAEFQFDMPALKADKPIYDEEYCTSDHGLDDKIVPSTQGTHHYHYEAVFDDAEVQGIIKNLPYDWWLGGTLGGVSYGGRIEDYKKATHPTIKYAGPQDIKHKQDGDYVNIAQAMIDFRFFYPDFGEGKTDIFGNCSLTDADWAEVKPHDYNQDTGYGLLQSEINTIKDFVKAGIIVLHRNTFDMPLTLEKSDQLTLAELTDMSESELSTQILGLALKLNDEQLKDLESSVLNTLTDDGRTSLTFEVLNTVSETELREMATAVLDDLTEEEAAEMKLSDLRKAVESKLKEIADTDPAKLRELAIQHFPDIEHDERAYLVIRALNIMSREALAGLSPAELENTAYTRQLLREKMIEVFSVLAPDHLRKMWDDAKKNLTDEDAAELLGDNTPEAMNAQQLATLVEHALAKITDEIISELNTDKYIHFTLLPIMPSQENFVDELYIFCPDPRGVKIRVTTNSPRMLDGFADMPYPDDMDNVPVRVGLSQITAVSYDDAADAKTLRMPLRKLGSAQKSGTHEMHLQGSGYADYLYLVETDDPAYQYGEKKAGEMKPALLIEGGKPGDNDAYHLVAKVKQLQASYADSNNFMDLQFDPAMKFREGYTYRLAFNFMEFDEENAPTISCYGTMLFDMKVVPEYQKWTGAAGDDWTNDENWQRADRADLLADRKPVGSVIAGATDITSEDDYPTNDDNETAGSFIPMKFTNTLIATGADRMPHLYDVTPAHRRYTDKDDKVVEGAFATLNAETATDEAKYDMEVYDADGSWHGKGHYECGLFGTYVAKGITFEPATMLYNAHLLDYRKAWVEYELDANRNYTLSSPLQQTYSGEWYAPTSADNEAERGRQLTPHFYDIVYKTDLNDRFDPAFYQRSWDTGTANIYRCMEGDHKPSYLPTQPVINQYRALDWSRYYNDVAVDYSKGGFNIRPSFGLRKQDDGTFYRREAKVLVRLPKEDAEYNYYDKTPAQNTPQEQHESQQATPLTRDDDKHYRLFTDVIASQDVLTQTLSNEGEWSNDYYLVGNPFMAPLDMNKFFAANPDLTPGMYWLMHSDLQIASLEIDGDWQSTTGDDAHPAVAPLQGFFVKRSAGTGNYTPLQVTFTPEMQYVPKENETLPTLKARANAPAADGVLRIEASDDMGRIQSVAAVTFVTGAHDAYVTGEDAELLLDSNVADRLATVFTTAGDQAMQFNVLSTAATFVPFGVIAPDDETVSHLSFSGLSAFAALTDGDVNLYDAATGVFSPVDDGTVLTVEGNSSGRFFLVAGMKIPYTGLDAAPSDEDPTDRYNLHGIRVATPQRGNVTIHTSGRKEYNRR